MIVIGSIFLTIFLGSYPAIATTEQKGIAIWQKNTPNTIYLTFDDGPDPINTPKILDILKKNKVKATFFVLGRKAEKNPGIIKRIKDEGHTLGNHTFSHVQGTVKELSIIQDELDRTHQIIFQASGVNVSLYRPPYGNFDWRAYKAATKRGYQVVLWTFDLTDWDIHDPKAYIKRVDENLSGGDIILMHDGGPKREALVQALPKIIKLIREKGYTFGNEW